MSLKCGIVGLPNVGKSTLFNALTNSNKAQAANFPFCTIDPNIGLVIVLDERLEKISKITQSKKTIHTNISFVDIAGLVKGASKGEGLGNKFLSHIREVDAIVHLTRCFESEKIQNINDTVDPLRDIEIVETEMLLADLESIQNRLDKSKKKSIDEEQNKILNAALDCINNNEDISVLKEKFNQKALNLTGLLSLKPTIYVCNVDEESLKSSNKFVKMCIKKYGEKNVVIVSAEIENQINQLEKTEKKLYMKESGINNTGLDLLIKKGYNLLKLQTYFTSGPEESRAWTVEKNCSAPKAAGVIHSDFEKGFIKAETVSYEDFINCNGLAEAKSKGKLRLEGKDYIVKDGDILLFRFNT